MAAIEVRVVADGLWLWRQPHPAWQQDSDWEPEVASFAVESRGVSLLLDPLAPPPGAELPGGLQAVFDGRGAMETPLCLPEQRALVFERVLVSHGEPVHARADFEAALDREPWSSWDHA